MSHANKWGLGFGSRGWVVLMREANVEGGIILGLEVRYHCCVAFFCSFRNT